MEDVPTSVLTCSLGMSALAMTALLSTLMVITALVRFKKKFYQFRTTLFKHICNSEISLIWIRKLISKHLKTDLIVFNLVYN